MPAARWGIGAGGVLSAASIASGALVIVSSGGTASGDTLLSGGVLELLSGASDPGLVWSSGGTLAAGPGDTLSGQVIGSGQTVEVLSGGFASATVLNGGTLDLGAARERAALVWLSGVVEAGAGYTRDGAVLGSGQTLAALSGARLPTPRSDPVACWRCPPAAARWPPPCWPAARWTCWAMRPTRD